MEHQPGAHLHAFHGGLRLPHHKRLSCANPPQKAIVPERLIIALRQHAGPASKPVVTVGQHVKRGQLVARARANGANIHAPTSGLVRGISLFPTPEHPQQGELCIELESDEEDCWATLTPLLNWRHCPPTELIRHIHEHGVVGLGGAVFPSNRKLSGQQAYTIETLILNGAECEPYLSCDEALMLSRPQAVIQGARILRRAAGGRQVIVAIEDRMDEVARALRAQLDSTEKDWLHIVQVPTYYPEGGERQLIQVLTGHEVPRGGLPQDLGLVVFNVGTAAAVHDAVILGQPLTERMITVTGHCVQQPGNWLTRIGTSIASLIVEAGGFKSPPERLIMGGPLMGRALPDDQLPVVKASNCILALSADEIHDPYAAMPCINCGFCVRVCPAQLLPQELHWAIRDEDYARAADFGLLDCIECGCCDQVCPSHIPLVEDYRQGKQALSLAVEEKRRARHAKDRYEARQQRLADQAEALQARRDAKKNALQSQQQARERIKAALERARRRKDKES